MPQQWGGVLGKLGRMRVYAAVGTMWVHWGPHACRQVRKVWEKCDLWKTQWMYPCTCKLLARTTDYGQCMGVCMGT